MGAAALTAAVADAGPLIHLAEIDALELLRVFDCLHIPDAVWAEAVGPVRVAPEALQRLRLTQRHTVSPAAVTRFVQENHLEQLQAGEQECLCLCQQIAVPVLLTDDLAVREAAQRLRLTPVGSLGIVMRADRQDRITRAEAERAITALDTISSLFVTRTIVELALERLAQIAARR